MNKFRDWNYSKDASYSERPWNFLAEMGWKRRATAIAWSQLYKCIIDDIFAIWCGPKGTLLEFLNALNSKTDRIKLTYCISESSISFLDLFLYRATSSNRLQFSTFQKPLNKYLYRPFKSLHLSSNKKAFIKGELMRYARNSSSFNSFYETREKFWKRLRVRGYPFSFLLTLFREIR